MINKYLGIVLIFTVALAAFGCMFLLTYPNLRRGLTEIYETTYRVDIVADSTATMVTEDGWIIEPAIELQVDTTAPVWVADISDLHEHEWEAGAWEKQLADSQVFALAEVMPEQKPTRKIFRKARLSMTEKEYDFGYVDAGEVVSHIFTGKNEGDAALMIKDVKVGCGCTLVDYPKTAIKPGKNFSIKVNFDTKGKLGSQKKRVTLITNGTPKSYTVYLKGLVYPPSKPQKAQINQSDSGN